MGMFCCVDRRVVARHERSTPRPTPTSRNIPHGKLVLPPSGTSWCAGASCSPGPTRSASPASLPSTRCPRSHLTNGLEEVDLLPIFCKVHRVRSGIPSPPDGALSRNHAAEAGCKKRAGGPTKTQLIVLLSPKDPCHFSWSIRDKTPKSQGTIINTKGDQLHRRIAFCTLVLSFEAGREAKGGPSASRSRRSTCSL